MCADVCSDHSGTASLREKSIKSRDIQVKMPSPKVIFNAIFPVPVKVLNSYKVTQEESDTFRKSLGLDLRKVLLLKNVL